MSLDPQLLHAITLIACDNSFSVSSIRQIVLRRTKWPIFARGLLVHPWHLVCKTYWVLKNKLVLVDTPWDHATTKPWIIRQLHCLFKPKLCHYIVPIAIAMNAGIAHDVKNDNNGGSKEEKLRLIGEIKHARVVKWCLEAVIVAACAFWVGWWLVSPDPEDRHKYVDIWIGDKISNSRFFNTDGHEGVYFLCF